MTLDVILRPVKAGNTFEQTVERLAQAIKLGAVVPPTHSCLYWSQSVVLARNIEHSDTDHVEFVEAILARRPARARKVMEDHLESTAALLRGFRA